MLALVLPMLLQTASAAGMPQKLLVPEPPTNYKITITRSYDPAINWQITVLEDGDLYASGKETDLEDEKTILDGTVWMRDGEPGRSGDELTLGEAFGMADTVYSLYPYTLVPAAGNLQVMIDELSEKDASNSAVQEMQSMHQEKVEQAINANFEHLPDENCGDATCSVFRQVFQIDGIEDPGYADYFVDAETGYVKQILSFHAEVEVDGETLPEWTETALFEYDVPVQ